MTKRRVVCALLLFMSASVQAEECISKDFGGGNYIVQCADTVTIIRGDRTVVCSKRISGTMSCTEVLK